MNFLAHIYLSGNNKDLIIGNFIADAIRGNHYSEYSEGIIKGIKLHRKIDTFTDNHPIVEKSKSRVRKNFSKYSGVVIDIYYDHFLAKNWQNYSEIPLLDFTHQIYELLLREYDTLPELVHQFLPHMIAGNWLYNYGNLDGMDRVFQGMSRRAKFYSNMENAVDVLKEEYDFIKNDFELFFPELKSYVNTLIEAEK